MVVLLPRDSDSIFNATGFGLALIMAGRWVRRLFRFDPYIQF